jgi:hypothetical protein
MAYAAVTAFLLPKEVSPEDCAKFFSLRWAGMSPTDLEAELLPVFTRMQRACDELKRTGRIHVIEERSD